MKNFLLLTKKYFLNTTDILYQLVFLIMQSLKLVLPFLMSYIIDSYFVNKENTKYLRYSIILYLGISILYYVISYFINKLFYVKLNKSSKKLQLAILDRIMRSDTESLISVNPGEINYYIFSDVNTIKGGWSALFGSLFAQLISMIFIFKYINFNSILSYLTFILLVINSIILFLYLQIIDKKIIINKEKAQEAVSKLYEIINHIECIHIYSLARFFSIKFEEKVHDMNKKAEDYFITEKLFELVSSLLNSLWTLIIIIAGARLIKSNNITVGALFAFINYSNLIFSPVNSLITAIKKLKDVNVSSNRILHFYSMSNTEKTNLEIKHQSIDSINSIELRNLTIYKSRSIIKKNINFSIQAHGIYVIVGKNGSGKTTLLKNISSLYNEYEGEILINSTEKKYLDIELLKKKIIFVDHKESIFGDSLEFNLLLDSSDISKIQFYTPYIAQSLLNKLPYGLQTDLCPDNKYELSNGEKQLIYIIRALLREPSVLLIDEPESALDKRNKGIIINLLLSQRAKRTIVIATHDQDFINIADEVLSFDE